MSARGVTSHPYSDPDALALTAASFAEGGLPRESFARPGKLFTASESIVVGHAGILTPAALRGVVEGVTHLLLAALK